MLKCLLMLFMLNFMFLCKFLYYKMFSNLYISVTMFIWMLNMNINNFYNSNIYLFMSFDFISYNLILLSFWIINLSLMANYKFLQEIYYNYFLFILMNLMMLLMLCFLSMDLMMFYIFFEVSIIPMLILIMGWGLQIDRIQASMYMLLYTLLGSLPLMLMIFYIYKVSNSMIFMYLNMIYMKTYNFYSYMLMILAFLIKMPMYYVHLWLPKAHVEAPISGSMILAGIMLKLGSYGLIRLMMFMKFMFLKYNFIIMNVSLIGGIYASILCLNLNDYKIIVAYSSVVHMSTLMSSMLTMNMWGYIGSMMMMIAHGLCSSGMFFMVNLNYERIYSRSTNLNKGMINIYPSLSLLWFLICVINMSAPPSMNLISEIMIFNSLISWSKFMMIYMLIVTFFSSCYSIFIYSFSQHGKFNLSLYNFYMINCREYLIILMHLIPLNLIILNLNLMF